MAVAGVTETAAKKIRAFSPGFTGIKKAAYILLRAAHMLFSFCILPACILYVQTERGALSASGVVLWLMVGGAVLWAMLYIILSQFAYPVTFWGALLATGGLVANGVSSANLGDFNLYYAAYSTAWCALLAQGIFFWGIVTVACIPRWQKQLFAGLPRWYTFFLIGCALALSAFIWLLHRPFVTELNSESRWYMLILYAAAFVLQVFGEIRTLYMSSAIDNMAGKQDKKVWNLFESYMPFAAVGLIFSLLAAMVAGLWQSGGNP